MKKLLSFSVVMITVLSLLLVSCANSAGGNESDSSSSGSSSVEETIVGKLYLFNRVVGGTEGSGSDNNEETEDTEQGGPDGNEPEIEEPNPDSGEYTETLDLNQYVYFINDSEVVFGTTLGERVYEYQGGPLKSETRYWLPAFRGDYSLENGTIKFTFKRKINLLTDPYTWYAETTLSEATLSGDGSPYSRGLRPSVSYELSSSSLTLKWNNSGEITTYYWDKDNYNKIEEDKTKIAGVIEEEDNSNQETGGNGY